MAGIIYFPEQSKTTFLASQLSSVKGFFLFFCLSAIIWMLHYDYKLWPDKWETDSLFSFLAAFSRQQSFQTRVYYACSIGKII